MSKPHLLCCMCQSTKIQIFMWHFLKLRHKRQPNKIYLTQVLTLRNHVRKLVYCSNALDLFKLKMIFRLIFKK